MNQQFFDFLGNFRSDIQFRSRFRLDIYKHLIRIGFGKEITLQSPTYRKDESRNKEKEYTENKPFCFLSSQEESIDRAGIEFFEWMNRDKSFIEDSGPSPPLRFALPPSLRGVFGITPLSEGGARRAGGATHKQYCQCRIYSERYNQRSDKCHRDNEWNGKYEFPYEPGHEEHSRKYPYDRQCRGSKYLLIITKNQ